MLKVTLIIFLASCLGCKQNEPDDLADFEQQLNRKTEASIDSAYVIINRHCDSMIQENVTRIFDSIIIGKKMKRK